MKSLSTSLLLALTLASTAHSAAISPRSSAPEVTIKNGTLTGLSLTSFGQEAFLGIPFAQPPVGDLRLRRPQRLNTSYEGTYEAKGYSPFCPGFGSDNWAYEADEDCLYLNVVRPEGTSSDSKLPVGVWIYGGGYQEGGSGDHRYNGSWIVSRSIEMSKPIIFVSINYRTAAGGFLDSAELRKEGNTNNGLHDQRLALEFIQENIEAFGGDREKVTIWGESAGAMSVSSHLLAYGLTTTPLFRAGILQSGSPTTENYLSVNDSKADYDSILQATGCSNSTANGTALACLRGLSAEAFNSSVAGTSWMPVIDGEIVPDYPTAQMEEGRFVQVPLLLGANSDEGTAFGARGINTTEQLKGALTGRYPNLSNSSIDKILQLYPDDPSVGSPYNTGDGYLSTGLQDKVSCSIFGDISMVAPRRLLAERASSQNPVFSYRFNQVTQNMSMETGVTHFQEVAYVFSNPLPTQNPLGNRPTDLSLAKLMTSYWISFIHDLDPNGNEYPDAPNWPDYASSASNLVFERQASYLEKDDWRAEGMAFINQLGKELGH
ncbi:alpha/beta-hydrolase [Leucosporidium creatinivorum]|uniref:Carboxylic ester hydrolase n=1 Tax=Leucosporidium creatinivorum TaxID=106004 RepID=A0A1Y2FYK2_9BASI|nr:alpha/beta-hydrolase [Leucosporidium creatinivorum]